MTKIVSLKDYLRPWKLFSLACGISILLIGLGVEQAMDWDFSISFIMTSSIQAFEPSDDLTQYAGTKAALMATSKSLAAQLADKGIRVNSVAPGPIWTPLQVVCNREAEELAKFGQNTYLKRAGQPVELADVYVFLASDASSYVTAQVYGITGGGRIA